MRMLRLSALLLVLAGSALSLSCGYHMAGKADTLPDSIHTIAVRPFQNLTTEYKIEQFVTQAVVREFITRTRYHVVIDESDADATFSGAVVNFLDVPTNYDPNTGRASTVQTITQLHVMLTDRAGQRLYENPNYEFRELYEVSIDPEVYFEERVAAIERASRSMARDLVSAVLEDF